MMFCMPLLGGAFVVPCSGTKKATHSPAASILHGLRLRDGDVATGDVHVPHCIDGTCVWQRRSTPAYASARIRSSCLSPKPITLNPETESGTSGAGPGPGAHYTPPATHEWETEQTCELCGQTPPPTLRRFLCEWRWRKRMRYEQLSSCCSYAICEKSLLKLCGDQRPPSAEPQVSYKYTSDDFFQSSIRKYKCQTEETPAAGSFYESFRDQNMRTY